MHTTTVNFTSPILVDPAGALKTAGSKAVMDSAREFREDTKKQIVEQPKSGRLYARKRGEGFRRSHRASARGERPAIDSGKLLNSIEANRTGDLSAQVVVTATSDGFDYPAQLQEHLDRPIMDENDARHAQDILDRRYEGEIAKIV